MRILHTLAERSLGGLEFRVLEQSGWLHGHGYEVAIAAPADSEISCVARQRGLRTVDLDFSRAYSPSTILKLRRAVKALRIDVIDSHSRADGKTAALCRDLCAVVRTRHFAKSMRSSPRRRLEWKIGCDHVIATSHKGKHEILAAGLAADERISVVGEWAADEFFLREEDPHARLRTRQALGIDAPEDACVIATIGMLRPEKGQADLLRVVQRLRGLGLPATALVVGRPTASTQSYGQALHQLAADLGIVRHTIFAGHRNNVSEMIRAADVILVPSATEAWSRIVPEAYAAGRPVVASEVGGLPEIVAPGLTGWLAPPGDIAGFADHIMQIRSQPERAGILVANARAYAETNFRLAGKMFSTLEAYKRTLAGG